MGHGSVVEEQVWDREYVEHRRMARAMLAREFPSLPDPDEIYQEAWVEALELRARGQELKNLGGLLRVIVLRRARDRVRKLSPQVIDPDSGVFGFQVDPDLLPDEQVQLRIDGAMARQVVDSLDARQAAAIKLRFDQQLSSSEIQQQLGVTRKRLDKIFTSTYRQVEAALTDLDDSSEWRRRQRSLLYACETGVASARQRRAARRMVEEDPRCRAMLQEIRSTLSGIAAVIPVPLLLSAMSEGRFARVRFVLVDRASGMRDQLADWTSRLLRHSPSAEQAGFGGVASAAGTAAIKATLVCVAITGGTVACLATGILGPTKVSSHRHHPKRVRHARTVRVAARPRPVTRAKIETVHQLPVVKHHHHHTPSATTAAAVAPVTAAPPPSPALAHSTEFGPGTVGSTSAASRPAAAPSGGGGEFTP
jgi:RNA polymerase sigma factor (sigma-70 family)